MTARPVAAPEDQLVLELPGLPPLRLVDSAPRRPRRPAAPVEPTPPVLEPTAAAVGKWVWLVWEDDEVLGVYADPDSAGADCAVLRRHAHRERLDIRYDWMAVPVFGGRRHDPPPAAAPRRRW